MTATDIEGLKAIRAAIKGGDADAVLSLISQRPARLSMETPFGSWLHVAASSGQLDVVTTLVALGLDVNVRAGILGGAPVNEAASGGHQAVVEFLLSRGATLDVSAPERNPLFGAIYGGHLEIARLLLHSGIDFKIRYSGKSMKEMGAYEFAVERGQSEMAALLKDWERMHG